MSTSSPTDLLSESGLPREISLELPLFSAEVYVEPLQVELVAPEDKLGLLSPLRYNSDSDCACT